MAARHGGGRRCAAGGGEWQMMRWLRCDSDGRAEGDGREMRPRPVFYDVPRTGGRII